METESERKNNGWGGRRAGAGRGHGVLKGANFTDLCRQHTPQAVQRLVQLMNQDEDRRIAYDAACMLIAHGHGKPRERVVHEQQDIMTVQYRSVEEIEASLIAKGFPLERLNAPKLIKHERSS